MTGVAAPALAGHRFLRGMPAQHLAYLAEVTSLVTVPARQRLFEAGEVAHHCWLIRAGQVEVARAGQVEGAVGVPGAGRVVIQALGGGEMLGVSWFFPPFQWQFGAVT